MAPPKVSSDVLSYCTSCRMDLNHLVVAMQGDRIAKVECRTCRKIHTYRTPKGITDALPPGDKPARAKRESVSVESTWDKTMAQKRSTPSKPYNVKASFSPGDKVNHPKFGEGFVEALVHPNKVKILFRDDIRVLVHGGVGL